MEGAKTDGFAIQYGPGKGTLEKLPMPWDTVYLTRWFAFLQQVGNRYGKSSAFRLIAAAGPTSVSAEMTLPKRPADLRKWQNDAYTPRKYIEAWRKVLQVYRDDFPHQYVSLSVGAGLHINDQGRIDASEGVRTRQAVIDQAIALCGARFVLQNSDLNASQLQHEPTAFVMGYSGQTITGLQMRKSAELDSAAMGVAGNPPLALKESIKKGMALAGARDSIFGR